MRQGLCLVEHIPVGKLAVLCGMSGRDPVAWSIKDRGKVVAGPFMSKWKAVTVIEVMSELKRGNTPPAGPVEVVKR